MLYTVYSLVTYLFAGSTRGRFTVFLDQVMQTTILKKSVFTKGPKGINAIYFNNVIYISSYNIINNM